MFQVTGATRVTEAATKEVLYKEVLYKKNIPKILQILQENTYARVSF